MTTGFGRDTWCADALQPGRLVSGNTLLAQALYRRWTTPRGTLRGGDEEAVYGIDVVGMVGSLALPQLLASMPDMMRAEALKDDRVADCRVTVVRTTASDGTVTIYPSAVVTPADGNESFTMTLAVTDVTVTLLGGWPK